MVEICYVRSLFMIKQFRMSKSNFGPTFFAMYFLQTALWLYYTHRPTKRFSQVIRKKNAIHSKVKARKKITSCKLLTLSHSINFPAVSLDVPWMKRSSLWTLIWMTTTSAASASWRQIQGPYLSATSALISALKVEPLLFFVCFCFLNQMLTRWTDTS